MEKTKEAQSEYMTPECMTIQLSMENNILNPGSPGSGGNEDPNQGLNF